MRCIMLPASSGISFLLASCRKPQKGSTQEASKSDAQTTSPGSFQHPPNGGHFILHDQWLITTQDVYHPTNEVMLNLAEGPITYNKRPWTNRLCAVHKKEGGKQRLYIDPWVFWLLSQWHFPQHISSIARDCHCPRQRTVKCLPVLHQVEKLIHVDIWPENQIVSWTLASFGQFQYPKWCASSGT